MLFLFFIFVYIYILFYILTDLIIKRVFEALFAGSIGYIGFEELVWGSIFGGYLDLYCVL